MVSLQHTLKAILTLTALGLNAPAFAETVEESVVRQLRAQGFTEFEVQRTFLGRLKIEARNATIEREIVINPTTGEILRDYWEYRSGNKRSSNNIVIPQVGGSTSSSPSGGSSSSSSSTVQSATAAPTPTLSSNSGSISRNDDDDDDDDDHSSRSDKGRDDRDNDSDDDKGDEKDDHRDED